MPVLIFQVWTSCAPQKVCQQARMGNDSEPRPRLAYHLDLYLKDRSARRSRFLCEDGALNPLRRRYEVIASLAHRLQLS